MFIGLLSGYPAWGQTLWEWDGAPAGTGSSWATSANWLQDAALPNGATSNVLIANKNGTGTIALQTVSATRTLGLITFDNAGSRLATTLNVDTNQSGTTTNRTLTLHSGITLQNTTTSVVFRGDNGNASIATPTNGILDLAFGAPITFTTSAGSTLTMTEYVKMSGAFGLTTAGSGTVILSALNTYSGGTTVGGGSTLRIGNSSTVTAGALVDGPVGTGTLTLQPGSTLTPTGGTTRTVQNSLSLSGNITLGATVTFIGNLNFNSTGLTTPATVALTGNTHLTSNVNASITNVIGGAFSLTKQGPGTLQLNAINTFSGGTIVAGGTLEIGRTGSMGSGPVQIGIAGGGSATLDNYLSGWSFPNDITVAADSGGTLTLAGSATTQFSSLFSGDIALNDDLTVEGAAAVGVTNAMRLTGSISGSKNLTKTGSGILRLEAANAGYSGTTTISAGTVQLGNGGNNGGIGTGNIVNNSALRINRGNSVTLSNAISGTGSLTQAGAGVTTLSGTTNSYTGATIVSAGMLEISGGISATTSVSLTGGTLVLSGASESINGAASLSMSAGTKVAFGSSLSGRAQTFASLDLLGSAILDYGDGSTNQLAFSTGITGLGNSTLSIYHWSSDAGARDILALGNTLDSTELGHIHFFADGAGQEFLGTGAQIDFTGPAYAIVPVPEPSSTGLLGAAALLGLVGYRERRRFPRAAQRSRGG